MKTSSLEIAKYVLISFTFLCCDEALPPRDDPQNPLSCTVGVEYTGAPDGNDAHPQQNSLLIYITLKNNYDDVIQGYGIFGGGLEIAWADSPELKRTIHLDKS